MFRARKVVDPRGRPTVTAGNDHYFRTCCLYVRPSVRPSPLLKISQNKTKVQAKLVFVIGGTVGLAEWIIEDTHVLLLLLFSVQYSNSKSGPYVRSCMHIC